LDRIAPGTGIVVTIAGDAIALYNVGGRIFALDDHCVRCGSSLASGVLEGALVSCSGCDWQYDVTTGCVCGVPALCIDTFEVKIEGPWVLVAAPPRPSPR
jgi:nitrite reductase/ring-hydroxylating ferredoxin subunit